MLCVLLVVYLLFSGLTASSVSATKQWTVIKKLQGKAKALWEALLPAYKMYHTREMILKVITSSLGILLLVI